MKKSIDSAFHFSDWHFLYVTYPVEAELQFGLTGWLWPTLTPGCINQTAEEKKIIMQHHWIVFYGLVDTNEMQNDQMMRVTGEQCIQLPLTSLSRPAATVTMSPVSLLMVNMLGMGVLGVCERMR